MTKKNEGGKLTFLFNIGKDSFLVGNENKIDLISIEGYHHGFVDTKYLWSIDINKPIEKISINAKSKYQLNLG